MKKLNKKGFTIVELVIVIAVIAILAGVLIPTFATVVTKANQSKAMQEARNEYQAYLAEYAADLTGNENFYIVAGKYAFEVKKGQFDETVLDATAEMSKDKADLSKVYVKATAYTAETKYFTKAGGIYTATTVADATTFNAGTFYVEKTPATDLGSTTVYIYAK
mgnify:CR=1 FL=1